MADNVGSIEYDSRISTDKLKRDAAEVDRLAKKAGDDLADHSDRGSHRAGESFQKFGKIAAAAVAAAGVAVVAFGVSSAKAFIESQNAIAQTEAVLKSTGGVAGVTAKNVTDLANSLQKQTRYSDESIRSAENMLLTFTNIGKKTFPGATQAVLDMSTAMGTDLNSTAIQVGKALQDPVAGATALQRVGVRLTQSQKDLIQSLVASGDAAGAQAVILKELQTEFGGSAKAAGETFAGRLDILKNQLGELQEGVGELMIRALGPLVTNLLSAFNAAGGVTGIMKTLGDTFGPVIATVVGLAQQVGAFLGPSFAALGNTLGTSIIPLLERLMPFLSLVGQLVGGLVVLAIWAFINVLNVLANVLGWVGQVVANVARWFVDRWYNIKSVWDQAAGFFSGVGNSIAQIFSAVKDALVRPFREAYELIKSIINRISDAIEDVKNKAGGIASGIGGGASRVGSWLNPFRAAGGPVSAGRPYIVGENRPELFVPRTSGTIIPEVPTGIGGSNITVNVNMSGIMARSKSDERDIAKSLVRRLNEELAAKGQPIIAGGNI